MSEQIDKQDGEKNWLVTLARENWWRVLLFILLTANLWLSQKYVTRNEYKDDKNSLAASVDKLSVLVVELKTQMAVRDAQNNDKIFFQQLADHEARLRELERSKKQP